MAELSGDMVAEFGCLERSTAFSTSELIRQGLIRLIREFRGTGKLIFEPLSVEGAASGDGDGDGK